MWFYAICTRQTPVQRQPPEPLPFPLVKGKTAARTFPLQLHLHLPHTHIHFLANLHLTNVLPATKFCHCCYDDDYHDDCCSLVPLYTKRPPGSRHVLAPWCFVSCICFHLVSALTLFTVQLGWKLVKISHESNRHKNKTRETIKKYQQRGIEKDKQEEESATKFSEN